MEISTEEILKALRGFDAPCERPAGAFTVKEAADLLQLGLDATRRRLHLVSKAGQLEVVRFRVPTLDGRVWMTVGYRIKSKVKAKARA